MFTMPQIGGSDCFSHISCHSNFFGWGVLHIVDFSIVPVSQETILYLINVVNEIVVTSKSPFLCAVNHPQMTSVHIYIYILVGFPHLFIFNKTTIFYTCWKISKYFDVLACFERSSWKLKKLTKSKSVTIRKSKTVGWTWDQCALTWI
jgi:hypothetical protein